MTATADDIANCRRKRHIHSKDVARRVAAQARKDRGHAVFAYKCPVCGRYLLTSQPQKPSDITKAVKGQRAPLIEHPDKHNNVHDDRRTLMHVPTAEQADAINIFGEGLNMAIEALAGTGKSSTLRMMAESTKRRGVYLAFNRAVVDDAKASFPANVQCMTAHGLAFRHVGKNYQHRLNQPRMRSYDLSKRMGLTKPITLTLPGHERKILQPGYLASAVMKAMKAFAFSDDAEPGPQHIGFIDGIDLEVDHVTGRRKTTNNDYVAEQLLPHMRKAWADWQDPDGGLPFFHDSYVKIFERREPSIAGEYLLLDEAQDLSPVMISIAEQQQGMQLCVIGDRFQQLYEWRGSVDAMTLMDVDARTRLSMSFRFGTTIATLANTVLHWIHDMPEDVALSGRPGTPGEIGYLSTPDAILCRTNAIAIKNVLELQAAGHKPHLVGGGHDVAAFARAARDLKDFGNTQFHELACFDSWLAVQSYVADDPQGSELALMVRLVDDFGVDAILDCIDHMPPEQAADVIVSTGHKAKGREWNNVKLGEDFEIDPQEKFPDDAELRLLYVAITRAREQIDISACGMLPDLVAGAAR